MAAVRNLNNIHGLDYADVYLAPKGTTGPTITNALEPVIPNAFLCVGWLSDDAGVGKSQSSSEQKVNALQRNTLVRKFFKDSEVKFTWTALELNSLTAKLAASGTDYVETAVGSGVFKAHQDGSVKPVEMAGIVHLHNDDGTEELFVCPVLSTALSGDGKRQYGDIGEMAFESAALGGYDHYIKPSDSASFTVA